MIIIDNREDARIIKALKAKAISIGVKTLETGDYIIGNTLIERKTGIDFINSISSGRIWNQLDNLRLNTDYRPLIAITSSPWRALADRKYSHGSSLVFGAFIAITISFKIPLIQFDNDNDFVLFLLQLEKKQDKAKSSPPKLPIKKSKDVQLLRIDALSCIPGVSIVKAQRILEQTSIKKLSNMSVDDLEKIEGVGKGLARNIRDFFM
jgi:ERCC4-type nuclease